MYTLVAYDEHHSYSYPIESIVQHPCNVEYASEEQYSEIGVQPYVKRYQRYDDDLTLISILSEYYKQFDNKVGLSELKQLSKKNQKLIIKSQYIKIWISPTYIASLDSAITAIYHRNFKPKFFTDITTPKQQFYISHTGKIFQV